ncbi:cytochrome P450 monooxygenase [Paraphaeosphaeria sporulosa]|uniref:Cytochrome P450 monooxygenase n=1 Tax=Paraphaeosphaeria sporulosa TaxID=1460663 RepID=A0A177CP03_9PLEO|nr:cytochrome P450 monooxygenase [Paraphaeosphaeria sporulosa]OAG08648.1 cytochrome P450 monooxygenase [Paraphaeosphaeria sporulosa]
MIISTLLALQCAGSISIFLISIFRKQVANFIQRVISTVLNAYLARRYAIKNVDDRSNLPSCTYEWPNGQGDKAKFLEGHRNSELWEAKFGAIYRLCVVTKSEHVRAVFKDSDKHMKAVNNNSGHMLGELLGQCVGLISQNQWKRVRSIMDKPFHRSMATTYIPTIKTRTDSFFQELWNDRGLARGLLDPAEDLKLLPFLVVAEVIYGRLTPDVEAELRALAPQRESLMRTVIKGGLTRFYWAQYLPTQANRDLAAFQKRWLAFNELAHSRAVEGKLNAPIIDFFAARDAGKITTKELLHTLDEMLYANLDVTIGAVSWNVVFIAAYPGIQTRLRQEVAEKRRKADEMGVEFEPYLHDGSTLLAACVNESARLRPLAAFSVPQGIPTSRVIGGFKFPAGTNFVVDSYALNIRNPFWGEDRAKYIPDRFLAQERTNARYHYWRFGFGPRVCLGQFVADVLIRTMLLHLVDSYDLEMTKSEAMEDWQRNPQVWINHPNMRLVCTKRNK